MLVDYLFISWSFGFGRGLLSNGESGAGLRGANGLTIPCVVGTCTGFDSAKEGPPVPKDGPPVQSNLFSGFDPSSLSSRALLRRALRGILQESVPLGPAMSPFGDSGVECEGAGEWSLGVSGDTDTGIPADDRAPAPTPTGASLPDRPRCMPSTLSRGPGRGLV